MIAFFDEGLPIFFREFFFCASLSPSSKKVVKSSKDSKEASQEFSYAVKDIIKASMVVYSYDFVIPPAIKDNSL